MRAWFLVVLVLASWVLAESLECFEEEHKITEMPYWQTFCNKPRHWMHNSRAENCIKIVAAGHVERSCDSGFHCTRFHVRNRCIKNLLGPGSEVCCCSTDRCNSSTAFKTVLPSLLSILLSSVLYLHIS